MLREQVAQYRRWCFIFALISIVFRTNQIRDCYGILQSRSFRKACAALRVLRLKLGRDVRHAGFKVQGSFLSHYLY